MHEASVVESLVRMLGAESARHGGRKVTAVNLVVGQATGYMEESLAFYLSSLSRGTPAEGAALSVRYVKPLLKCAACGLEFERARFSFACPACGGEGRLTGAGSEFYVDSIELADDAADGVADGVADAAPGIPEARS